MIGSVLYSIEKVSDNRCVWSKSGLIFSFVSHDPTDSGNNESIPNVKSDVILKFSFSLLSSQTSIDSISSEFSNEMEKFAEVERPCVFKTFKQSQLIIDNQFHELIYIKLRYDQNRF